MFALVAESLPRGQRARGFMIQSVLRRVPILFAPALGGLLVERLGLAGGLRVGFLASVALALSTLFFQRRFYRPPAAPAPHRVLGLAGLWRVAPTPLKRLLLADVLARCAESAADVFVVLYALDHLHASPIRYGAWIGLQTAVSIGSYFPGAWIADRFGRKPPVIFTFLMFALFPLLVGLAAAPFALSRARASARPVLGAWLLAWALTMLAKEPFLFPRPLRWAKEDQFVSPLLALLIGAGIGYWADVRFGSSPWLLLLGTALGFAAFVVRLFRLGREQGKR